MSQVTQRAPGVPGVYGEQLKRTAGTNPAANAEISETVPSNEFWLLLAVSVSLVQGITQTPQPTLLVDDGTTTLFQSFGASSAQNSSVTTQYTWAPGLSLTAGGAATVATAPLPANFVLGPGYRIRTSTLGIGANTDYGAPSLYYVRYYKP